MLRMRSCLTRSQLNSGVRLPTLLTPIDHEAKIAMFVGPTRVDRGPRDSASRLAATIESAEGGMG